jgi:5'-nucleotidase
MRKLMFALLMVPFALTSWAQNKKEVHILSANDMHAAIECFPRLCFVADSLRALYPDLLILSAGDNRSGDPINDMYEIPAYPMVSLMNIVGFQASTLGNHEFDSGQEGLAKLIGMSNFPYLCANIQPAAKTGIHVRPWQMFDVGGVRLAIIGVTALGPMGKPESHPDNMTDLEFTDPLQTVQQYKFLRNQSDVVLLLSHMGYEDDVKLSAELPWVDLIVGGHSHTQLKGGEIHNGLLITQNVNRLARVTHITLTVENGKVTGKRAENIAIKGVKRENKVVAKLADYFTNNPAFDEILAVNDKPLSTYEELGCLMTDAYLKAANADISLQNYGGVRYDTLSVRGISVKDVLQLDPFQNSLVEMTVTGNEFIDILKMCFVNDQARFPLISGATAEYVLDADKKQVKKVVLYGPDGKKLNLKKTYRVVTNNYVQAITPTNRKDEGHSLGIGTAQAIMDLLKAQGHIDYQGKTCVKEIKK